MGRLVRNTVVHFKTKSVVDVQKVVLGQWIGSLLFGIFGGQQLLILSTTAPLSIYIAGDTKIEYVLCSVIVFQ